MDSLCIPQACKINELQIEQIYPARHAASCRLTRGAKTRDTYQQTEHGLGKAVRRK